MTGAEHYLMENPEEIVRLEIKTDPDAVRKQALWCGLRPGLRVLDVGSGSGNVTSILHKMIQPGGSILGLDYSKDRVKHAKEKYGLEAGIDFQVHDARDPLNGMGQFDLIWVRFLLEYFRLESFDILRNLTTVLRPGGYLCLLDLDHNSLNHYELPPKMEKILFRAINMVQEEYNFDPYSGRKLYSYLYDLGYQDIQMDLVPHHLIYGKIKDEDIFNWTRKVETASTKTRELFESYPGGYDAFFSDFRRFLLDPRRFIYTPLILCKGMKPLSP